MILFGYGDERKIINIIRIDRVYRITDFIPVPIVTVLRKTSPIRLCPVVAAKVISTQDVRTRGFCGIQFNRICSDSIIYWYYSIIVVCIVACIVKETDIIIKFIIINLVGSII